MKLLFLLLCFTLPLHAGEWARSDETLNFIKGDLNFYNRSACAKKALEPTTSVFLIVDNVNIAKSVYRLAKRQGKDTKVLTDLGIEKFRYSLTTMMRLVTARILEGKLPLIPLKTESISPDLGSALSDCRNDNCGELYKYLEANWEKSSRSSSLSGHEHSSCKVVKKFSTFHSHLNVSKPDRTLIEEMAKELQNPTEFVRACDDFSDISGPEVALYQFDIMAPDNFNTFGFDFWNTLKIYLSWGFRNAPEMDQLAEPFDFLFKSANLEEMILLFSNGCASIRPTQCSQNDLTLNNLSFLTQRTKDIDWNSFDPIRHSPDMEPNNLFSKPLPLTEQDLLNLGDSRSADEWVKNFRDNFVHMRGYNKIKLTKALNGLRLITENLTSKDVLKKIEKDSLRTDDESKQQLYYLCAEFSIGSDRDLSIIRKHLWRLKDVKEVQTLMKEFTGKDFDEYWRTFAELTKEVNLLCKNLKQRAIWDETFELKKEGFAPWYRELVYEKKFSFSDDASISKRPNGKPFLSLKDGEVICSDGIHCGRQILDGMMSLSSVSLSLSSVTPDSSSVTSTNMANPYASHLSCGAYDPWAKRNQIVFNAIHDLLQAAVFGFLPTPVYVGATLDPKRVVSFETLVKEGQVFYDPRFNTNRLKLSLMLDLGPLAGVPCAISVSGSKLNPFQYYMFDGISVSSCKEGTRHDTTVGSGGDAESSERYRQACATCAINLSTLSSSASIINPAFRVSFFLIKGVVRLAKELKDPHDLARDWSISPQKVALSYRHDGAISKRCAAKLMKGDDCLPRDCEGKVITALTRDFQISPTRTDFSCFKGTGRIETKECEEPIYVNFNTADPETYRHQTTCKLKTRKL